MRSPWSFGRTVILVLLGYSIAMLLTLLFNEAVNFRYLSKWYIYLSEAGILVSLITLIYFEKRCSSKHKLAGTLDLIVTEIIWILIVAVGIYYLSTTKAWLWAFELYGIVASLIWIMILPFLIFKSPKRRLRILERDFPKNRFKRLKKKDSQAWQEKVLQKIKEVNEKYDKKKGSLIFQTSYQNEKMFLKKSPWRAINQSVVGYFYFQLSRPISAMSNKEREACRILELAEIDGLNQWSSQNLRAPMVWANGKGTTDYYSAWNLYHKKSSGNTRLADSFTQVIEWFIKNIAWYHNFDSAVAGLIQKVNEIISDDPTHPVSIEIKQRLTAGNTWLGEDEFDKFGFTTKQPRHGSVYIGDMNDGKECWVANEGAIITVAPPGSGKTQTHIIPNLLTWKGSALVLDVKGELWDKTAGYRAKHIGPVYRFNPLDPEQSHCYNPLTLVRNDLDYVWEDAVFLASIIVPRTDTKNPFWQKMARGLISAAIAVECINNEPEDRRMSVIVDYCYAGDSWIDFLTYLQSSELNELRRMGGELAKATQDTKQTLGNIRQEAQSAISSWAGRRIERATNHSDWHPNDLRNKPITIYISLKAGEIDAYADLLRVFIGQHIRTLIQKSPDRSDPDILFMLDEFPRLKFMPELEDALEIGRQYKINLFLAIQTIGQLEQHYKNAKGLISACKVKAFMNPSSLDQTAQKIISELGQVENIVDGTRRNIADITDLVGEEYADDIIIFTSGCKPIRAKKSFAYLNESFKQKMKLPPPDIAYDKELADLIDQV